MINDKVKKSEIGKKINQTYANIKTNSHNVHPLIFRYSIKCLEQSMLSFVRMNNLINKSKSNFQNSSKFMLDKLKFKQQTDKQNLQINTFLNF